MTLLHLLRDHFLVPAGAPAAQTAHTQAAAAIAAPVVVPAAVAVLCAPRAAAALGGAIGVALARRGTAVVCTWGSGPGSGRLPATPAARRLARALASRGHRAVPTGRIVRLTVEGDDAAGAAEAGRVLASAAVPTVLVVAGPRGARMDALLRAQDLVVVAEAGPGGDAGAALAARRLEDQGTTVVPAGPARGVAALLAARGGASAGVPDGIGVR